jgi:transposase
VDLKSELFAYDIDHDALALAELMDGKLLLVTNCTDLSPQGIVDRYKSLADIERGFRVLKSEIEIGPVFHRLPERIKAHASICLIALILYRVMRQRLRAADSDLSPERALELLQRLQHHQIRINPSAKPITGIARLSETHSRVFAALNLKNPAQPKQLSLL